MPIIGSTTRRVVSSDLSELPKEEISYLKHHITFARASYCINGLETWKCITCDARFEVQNIAFAGDFASTVFGYAGYAKSINTIVVAFRGTRTLDGWIQDLKIVKPDCPFPNAPKGAKVHLGFLEAWEFLKPQIVEALLKLVDIYPNSYLLITGHSLGGAISTLSAIELYLAFPNLAVKNWSVFTIGQPRVGNALFANWTRSFPFHPIKRLVYENDLVPHLPPYFSGFEHVPSELWIHGDNTFNCANENENENSDCANSYRAYSVIAHQRLWGDELIGVKSCFPQTPE